jgi:hypothetical protein
MPDSRHSLARRVENVCHAGPDPALMHRHGLRSSHRAWLDPQSTSRSPTFSAATRARPATPGHRIDYGRRRLHVRIGVGTQAGGRTRRGSARLRRRGGATITAATAGAEQHGQDQIQGHAVCWSKCSHLSVIPGLSDVVHSTDRNGCGRSSERKCRAPGVEGSVLNDLHAP